MEDWQKCQKSPLVKYRPNQMFFWLYINIEIYTQAAL